MKPCLSIILTTCVLLSSATSAAGRKSTRETFSNPVIAANWPDPTIWAADGHFYSVATGISSILRSDDLVSWESVGRPLTRESYMQTGKFGDKIWAPDVVRIGDRWMLYITCIRKAQDSRIVCYSSTSPTGPWSLEGVVTDSFDTGIKDTIDPEVVPDPETGRVWMFFGSTGKVHRVELNAEGTAIAPGAVYEHVAGLRDNENRSRDKVFEGTYLYRHDGWWYLLASVGQYWNETYRIVCGRSRTLDGTFLNREGLPLTEGNWTPVMTSAKGDRFFGPGHNGEIFTDSTGQEYILYHCHDTQAPSEGIRYTLLQRIFWDRRGWPRVEGGKPALTDIKPAF